MLAAGVWWHGRMGGESPWAEWGCWRCSRSASSMITRLQQRVEVPRVEQFVA